MATTEALHRLHLREQQEGGGYLHGAGEVGATTKNRTISIIVNKKGDSITTIANARTIENLWLWFSSTLDAHIGIQCI